MNREIKFRAWDKNDEGIHEDVIPMYRNGELENIIFDYENAGDDFIDIEIKFCDTVSLYENNPYIIMQYTGLLDKNGTEIYEGDIVHFKKSGLSGKGFIYWKEDVGQWWIKDIREATKKRGQRYYPFYEDAVYRIDGNIHQHSHLLGGVDE